MCWKKLGKEEKLSGGSRGGGMVECSGGNQGEQSLRIQYDNATIKSIANLSNTSEANIKH